MMHQIIVTMKFQPIDLGLMKAKNNMSDDTTEDIETLREKEYTPEECIFWISDYDGSEVIHITTKTLRQSGDDDSFGSHNLKDVETLPDYLFCEDSEMSWNVPENVGSKEVIEEMKLLGFEYAPEYDEMAK